MLASKFLIAPRRDPEFKGMVERTNEYLETSFLPGRVFGSRQDFNAQLGDWLPKANSRTVRSVQGRPVDLPEVERPHMLAFPPIAPPVGLRTRVRLARDYCVRVDGNDYSVDPRAIGRHIEVLATSAEVTARCEGILVARHVRSWGRRLVLVDPAHRESARALRKGFGEIRREQRRHSDGHPVALRALPDYDAIFGVDFDPAPTMKEGANP